LKKPLAYYNAGVVAVNLKVVGLTPETNPTIVRQSRKKITTPLVA
jgi:hypothetical protein